MAFLHSRNRIHHDLKSLNLFVTAEWVVKVRLAQARRRSKNSNNYSVGIYYNCPLPRYYVASPLLPLPRFVPRWATSGPPRT